MAQQRQRQGAFRFSLPWVTSSQTAPKKTLPQQTPPQTHSATSQNLNQQQTPPRAQQSKDIDTQKASPSRASPFRISSQSRNSNKSLSPSQSSSQSRSPTPSPSQVPKKSPSITQISSPPRINSQTRLASQTPSPSRTFPVTKQKSQKQEISRTLSPQYNETSNHPSTSQIFDQNERNVIGPEFNEDKEKQYLDEKSEETIKGKELAHEPKIDTQINDTCVTPLSGLKEPISSDENLASDDEPKQVKQEEIMSIKDTLNPTSSTKEQTKTIISDLANKDKDHISHHKGIKDNISKFVHKMTNEHENQASVITLTGENRGATMSLGYESRKRDEKITIRRDYKVISHESFDSATEGEKSSNEMAKDSDEDPMAYINSNIQSINNSVMYNSSITDRNPGVHLTMSRTATEHVDETIEDHTPKFNVANSQKLSYNPVVKRRCLKGLFMESSDSDPGNPDKPRRHGCRYICREKSVEDLL